MRIGWSEMYGVDGRETAKESMRWDNCYAITGVNRTTVKIIVKAIIDPDPI